jgi:hypothetical protein
MSSKANLILTSDNFFDTIEFQRKTEIEQVAYILFYVTEVAHLRKDMISDIIADRIQDQYESFFQRNKGASNLHYKSIGKKQVENILKGNPEWFQEVSSGEFAGSDRGKELQSIPYILTQSKKEDLWKIFDKDVISKISLQKKKLFLDKTLSTILYVVCLLLSATFIFNRYFAKNDELVVTSVQDYAKRINLNEYNPTKKGILFIYYVTELTKMRNEVEATAIHDRLIELQCEMPPQDELNELLDKTEMLKSSSQNPKTYSLTDIGINYAEYVVNSHIKKDTGLILSWEIITSFLTIFLSLLGLTANAAYKFGKQQ